MQEETQKETEVIIQPGFRFYPTEEELVSFYLHKKLEQKRKPELDRVIPVINIYDFEPWMLPNVSGELCSGDTEQWFFFVPRQEREARGGRPNRTTASGYWKATGSPSYVYSSNNRVIGVKKSMVFYRGKAPTGKKTTWKMNEYRAIEEEMLPSTSSPQSIPKLRHELSLCRVYIISGSFRAFDRRPLGPAGNGGETMMMMTTPQDDDDDVIGARTNATFSHHTTTTPSEEMFERRRWPAESSSAAAAKIQIINGFDTATDVNNGSGSINDWEMADPEFMKSLWD